MAREQPLHRRLVAHVEHVAFDLAVALVGGRERALGVEQRVLAAVDEDELARAAAPGAASASSLPIEPPAPVTSTVLPVTASRTGRIGLASASCARGAARPSARSSVSANSDAAGRKGTRCTLHSFCSAAREGARGWRHHRDLVDAPRRHQASRPRGGRARAAGAGARRRAEARRAPTRRRDLGLAGWRRRRRSSRSTSSGRPTRTTARERPAQRGRTISRQTRGATRSGGHEDERQPAVDEGHLRRRQRGGDQQHRRQRQRASSATRPRARPGPRGWCATTARESYRGGPWSRAARW